MQATLGSCPPRSHRAWAATAIVGLLAVVPSACGDPEDASLCTAFDEFTAARDEVQGIDPADESAADATQVVEDYLAGVHRLQQAADGRYGQELDGLEQAVTDVRLTLESVPDDADYATWGPLVEDDLEAAADAAVRVDSAIAPSCTPPDTDPSQTSETSETSGT